MKRFHLFFAFVLLFSFFAMHSIAFAQEEPVMYFCEKYGRNGEVGVSDRFTTGYLTVMVNNIELDQKYVYFAKNDESDMEFEDPGFYRVFLLDDRDRTVASAIIEIIR
jgi:hypothetical protein